MTPTKKKYYISIIQAQMTNYELFFYLINQIEHDNNEYKNYLKESHFFDDLYNSAFNIAIKNIDNEEIKKLIKL